jgi:hypothetical protein
MGIRWSRNVDYWERMGYAETGRKLDEMIMHANICGIAFDRFTMASVLMAFELKRFDQAFRELHYSPLFTEWESVVAGLILGVIVMLLVIVLR